MSGPFDDLRVLDLSDTMIGATASLLFADFGADVVHVERPGGSSLRRHAAYPMWGRGKKSIELDLTSAADIDTARGLARHSDVVIETWRPGVAERLGVGYDDLAVDSPGLVYVSVTGFGRTGPYAGVQGYEALVMAKLGMMSTYAGTASRPGPVFPAVPFSSWSAAQLALHGALAALLERERSGRGQRVDTTLVQAMSSHDLWAWTMHLIHERYPGAYSSAPPFDPDGIPSSPLVLMMLVALSADGRWMQFSQAQPHLFASLMRVLGRDGSFTEAEQTTLPRFETQAERQQLWARMLEAVRGKTLAEWQQEFVVDPNVWAETFRHGQELLGHPQLVHNGDVITVEDRDLGPVRQPGPMVNLLAAPAAVERSAPRLGEHAAELRELARAPRVGGGRAVVGREEMSHEGTRGTSPLAGVTVLELGVFFAGPYGATLLADLGARVIKVEPIEGEPLRMYLEFPEAGSAKVLQGKESIAVDLASDEGRRIVHELAGHVDVVVQSFRAGVARRLEVDSDTLCALNPDLLYLDAPAYGVDGPCCTYPAFAATIGAAAGLAMRNAGPSIVEGTALGTREVMDSARRLTIANMNGYAQADGFSALGVATAMLVGLLVRARRGSSGPLRTSMLLTSAHALSEEMVDYPDRPPVPTADPALHGFAARYRLYRTAEDGWVFLAAPAESAWSALAGALLSYADLAADPRFGTDRDRRDHDDELAAVLSGIFTVQPAAAWEQELIRAGIGCVAVSPGPVEDVLLGDDFGRANQMVVDVVHPTFGDYPRMAPLLRLSRSATVAEAGCLLGAHTDAILAELGYGTDTIEALRAAGTVQ